MLSFIRVDNGSYHWLINQAQRRFFESHFIKREDFLYESAAKNILKDNSVRTIFSIDFPELSVIVKRYKARSLLDRLKATFISKARREIKSAGYLVRQHINTVYPLGIMEKRKWGLVTDAFVFLKRIDGVLPLKELLGQSVSAESKEGVLKSLSELIRRAHQAGFFHEDLHLGNVLINPASLAAGTPDLYLIDLHRSVIRPHFVQSHGICNLAQMVYSLSTVLSRTDIYRFLKHYREIDFRRKVFNDFARSVFLEAGNLRHRHWLSRNKKCLKKSSGYTRIKIRGRTAREDIFISRSFSLDDARGLIDRHDLMAAREPGNLFKRAGKRLISCQHHGSADFFVKEYRYSFWRKILSFIGRHPAKQEWLAINGFGVRHENAAPPVALVEKRDLFFTWVNRGYVIARKVEAEPANQFLMRNFGRRITEPEALKNKINFIRQFALAVKRLHQKGIFHHDLKANNVIIKDERKKEKDESKSFISNPSSSIFCFIDLDRVSFDREVTAEARIFNLAQLNAAVTNVLTKSDRLRFYRFYSYGEECLPWKDRKNIIRQIMQATVKRRHFWPPPG